MPTDNRGTWFMYHPQNGEIHGVYSNTCDNMLIDLAGKAYIEAPDDDHDITNKYVEDGVVRLRPIMSLNISGSLITGIPQGSVVIVGEQAFPVDDGEANISGYTGTVRITCFPYLDEEVEI